MNRKQAEARHTDPAPSHEAARTMNRSGKHFAQCEDAAAVLRAYATHEPMTCAELAATPLAAVKFGPFHEAYIILGKRLPDLRDKWKVATNAPFPRRCAVKGVSMQTWQAITETTEPTQDRLF